MWYGIGSRGPFGHCGWIWGSSISHVNPKVKKEYERHAKKAMSIIALNLVDNQLAYIRRYKRPTETWNTLSNIHEKMSLSNILFVRHKFFICKMQEGNDMLDHINQINTLVD